MHTPTHHKGEAVDRVEIYIQLRFAKGGYKHCDFHGASELYVRASYSVHMGKWAGILQRVSLQNTSSRPTNVKCDLV